MSDVAALKRRVISDIKSIVVVYAKDGVSIIQLRNEYRRQYGQDIPYKKLGKYCLEDLLRSIPEHVCFVPKLDRVFPIIDEKSAHIVKLVTKTISKKDDKSNRGGRNSYEVDGEKLPAIKNAGSVPAASREQIENSLRAAGADGVAMDDFQTNFFRFNGINLNYTFFGFNSLEECLKSIPNVVTLRGGDTDKKYCVSSSTLEKVNALKQKENQTFLPSSPLQKPELQMAKEHQSSETPQYLCTQSIVHSNNQNPNVEGATLSNFLSVQIPEIEDDIHKNLKTKMQKVLENYSKGLYVDDFSDAFEELHKEAFDLEALGYFNIMELVHKFPDIFGLIRPDNSKGKVIIYDARKQLSAIQDDTKKVQIPEDIIKRIEQILETNQFGISLPRLEQLYNLNCETNLPYMSLGFFSMDSFIHELMSYIPFQLYEEDGIKKIRLRQRLISNNLVLDRLSPEPNETQELREPKIPADAVTNADANLFYSERIDERKNLDKYFQIVISEVLNPSFFWFQIVGFNTTQALELLMDELELAYNLPRGQDYMIPHSNFLYNMPCVALYSCDWHRAQMVGFPSNELVELFYVDYGTKHTVSRNDVRMIKERFMTLPTQAIKAKLAYLEPASNHDEWSAGAGMRLLELTRNKTILCKVLAPLDYKKGLKVVLCEQREEGDDVYINDILVNEGFAKPFEDEDFVSNCNENFYQEQIEMPFCHPSVPATPPGVTSQNFSPEPEPIKPTKAPPGFSPFSPNPILMKLAAKALKKQNYNSFDLPSPSPTSNPSSAQFDSSNQSKIPFRGSPIMLSRTATVNPNSIDASPKKVEFLIANPNVLTNANAMPENDQIESQTSLPPYSESSSYQTERVTSSAVPSQARYTKMEKFTKMYEGHVINYDSRLYLATGDISYFIYRTDVLVSLLKKLKLDSDIEMRTVEEEQCPSLFQELRKSGVRGFTKIDAEKSSVTLLPLESCVKVLKKIPPVRQDLEEAIQKVLENFDPKDRYWNGNQEDFPNETEDDQNITPECIRERLKKLEIERRIITKRMAEQEEFDSDTHLTYTQIMEQYSQYLDLDLSNANEGARKAFHEFSIKTNSSASQIMNEQQQNTQKSVQAVAPITANQTPIHVRTVAPPTNIYMASPFMTNQPNPQFMFPNMVPSPSVIFPNMQYMQQYLMQPALQPYQRPPPMFGASTPANNIYYNPNNNR